MRERQKSTLYVWYCNSAVCTLRLDEKNNKVINPFNYCYSAADLYLAIINPDNERVVYDQPPREFLIMDSKSR